MSSNYFLRPWPISTRRSSSMQEKKMVLSTSAAAFQNSIWAIRPAPAKTGGRPRPAVRTMQLRLSPSIARVRRAESLNYLVVNFTFEDANALTASRRSDGVALPWQHGAHQGGY